jgi:hypothetical protein
MRLHQLPLETWMVVNVADAKWDVVSVHPSRDAAETERDRRNRGLTEPRFSAFIAFEPVAERMGRPCGCAMRDCRSPHMRRGAGSSDLALIALSAGS